MKRIFMILGMIALGTTAANAAPRCSLHNLAACSDENELVWSRGDDVRHPHELYTAMTAFLGGAPKVYVGRRSFSAAQPAEDSLGGPGDHHDHLSDGGWFFDGFTPHDATERGAILLNADGTIRIVATLSIGSDIAKSNDAVMAELYNYGLRLYSHGEPSAADVLVFQNWARDSIKRENATYPTEPSEHFAGTQIFLLEKAKWQRRALP